MRFTAGFINPSSKFAPGISEPERTAEYASFAAKGEHIALQLVIEASEDIKGVCVKMEPFRKDDDKYEQIDASWFRMYAVESVYMGFHTEKNDNLISDKPGYYPDPLALPHPVDLAAGESYNLLITADIPEYTPAGDYTSNFMIWTASAEKIVLDAKLRVYDFTLADHRFDIVRWIHLKDISRFPGAEPGTPKFYEAVDRLAELLSYYGETIAFVPWADMDRFYRKPDGSYLVDSAVTREYIKVFKRRGFKKFLFKHIGWRDAWSTNYFLGFSIPYYEGGKLRYTKICDFFDEGYQTLLKTHLRDIQDIAESDMDGCEYFTHMFDEPVKHHRELMARTEKILKENCPSVGTLEAIRDNDLPTCNILDKCVFLWGDELELKPQIRGDFYWYICMQPTGAQANRFIDQNPCCYRVVPWLAWMYNIKGYLEWGFNCYGGGSWNNLLTDYDPRRNTQMSPESYEREGSLLSPSDSYLVYPDEDRFYMPSLRLEIFKLGLEEYKYVRMAAQLAEEGNAEAARALAGVRETLNGLGTYPLELSVYDDMKRRLGELLEKSLRRG